VEINIIMWITIFVINLVYVTLSTLRMMLTLKNYTLSASIISMAEIIIWVFGLGLVMENLDNIINVIMYALGFGVGIYVGSKIEDRLALGYILAEAIIPDKGWEIAEKVREQGYGVTITEAHGRAGNRYVLEILTPRRNERSLYSLIDEIAPKAFVISHEPKYVSGGFWTTRLKKSRKKKATI